MCSLELTVGIFVPEKYHGNKVATRLIKKVIGIAQELDVSKLYLQTERLDGGLYPRLGWKPIEQVEYKVSNVLVMENHIGAQAAVQLVAGSLHDNRYSFPFLNLY